MKLAAFQPHRALCIGAFIAATAWAEPAVNGSPAGIGPQAGGAFYGNPGAVSHGPISRVTGSFDTVVDPSMITSSDPWPNIANPVPDAFTLQINTNTFRNTITNTLCGDITGHPSCRGWQQFVYSRRQFGPPSIFIQFWLYGYNDTLDPGLSRQCPTSDTANPWLEDGNGCYRTEGTLIAPALTAADLSTVQFVAEAGSAIDPHHRITISVGAGTPAAASASTSAPNVLGLGQEWNQVEWNVLGDGLGRQVTFQNVQNSSSTTPVPPVTLVPRIRLVDGTTAAPTCEVMNPTSAETNNLGFGQVVLGTGPTMTFTESSDIPIPVTRDKSSTAAAHCALAYTLGDTHVQTFGGLSYDFQATGDFVLARIDKDFMVQARQAKVLRWPDAAVNQAVGVRVGQHRVAICLAQPARVVVDGLPITLKDGGRLDWPDHTNVRRRGNVYLVQGATGHSLRAEVNDVYINASVGLGHWPATVSGLLADVAPPAGTNSKVPRLAIRDGKALPELPTFATLYGNYTQSWRVSFDDEPLLKDCGPIEFAQGVPAKPFSPANLDAKTRDIALATCSKAGVKQPAFLQACVLDVGALGNPGAAAVFTGMPPPVAVLQMK
jgi:hypothetical protein